jgi:hypothetical protein
MPKGWPLDRLLLRVVCRVSEWPRRLEDGLATLLGSDGAGGIVLSSTDAGAAVQAYELAPLRRVDVVRAAEAEGLDAAAFLREVARMEVAPLAGKPVTLRFLLNLYRAHRAFPRSQAEL